MKSSIPECSSKTLSSPSFSPSSFFGAIFPLLLLLSWLIYVVAALCLSMRHHRKLVLTGLHPHHQPHQRRFNHHGFKNSCAAKKSIYFQLANNMDDEDCANNTWQWWAEGGWEGPVFQVMFVRLFIFKCREMNISWYRFSIQQLQCTILPPSVLVRETRITSLTVFLKYGQLVFSKASGSISDHLTSIFPDFYLISWISKENLFHFLPAFFWIF